MAQPVYPPDETSSLKREIDLVQKERKDLPAGCRPAFEGFKSRLDRDDSRKIRRIATSALRRGPPVGDSDVSLLCRWIHPENP